MTPAARLLLDEVLAAIVFGIIVGALCLLKS